MINSLKQDTNQYVPLSQFKAFINEINSISTKVDTIDVALTVIHDTCDVLNCDRTSFFFVDGDYLDLVIAKGVDSIRLPKNTGFAGLCATTAKLVNIPDAYQDSRFDPKWDKKNNYHTKQMLCAPVIDNEEVVGVLQAINKKNDSSFDYIDEQLISCLASQIAVTIRCNVQLEEARQAKAQKDALISYIKSMDENTNVSSLLFTLNKAATELLEADRCSLYTVNHQLENLHLITTDASVDINLSLNQGIAGYVGRTGVVVNIPDCYQDSRFNPAFDKQTGYRTRSMLVAPVFADVTSIQNKEKPIAVVQLINKQKGESVFDSDDEEILRVLLSFIGPLIKDSSLFHRKQQVKEAVKLIDISSGSITRLPSNHMVTSPHNQIIEGSDEENDMDLVSLNEQSHNKVKNNHNNKNKNNQNINNKKSNNNNNNNNSRNNKEENDSKTSFDL